MPIKRLHTATRYHLESCVSNSVADTLVIFVDTMVSQTRSEKLPKYESDFNKDNQQHKLNTTVRSVVFGFKYEGRNILQKKFTKHLLNI